MPRPAYIKLSTAHKTPRKRQPNVELQDENEGIKRAAVDEVIPTLDYQLTPLSAPKTPRRRPPKAELAEVKEENEKIKVKATMDEMVQTMDYPPTPPAVDLSLVVSDKLDQLLVAMQYNQVSIDRLADIANQGVLQNCETTDILRNFTRITMKNELIYQCGLTEILTGPLGFIKDRLTAENGDLYLDGRKIEDIKWFKRIIQTKPWVVFNGEYAVPCMHCHYIYDLVDANEGHTYITCSQIDCQKRTPFCAQSAGVRWSKCSKCSVVMIVGSNITNDMECLTCKQSFNPCDVPEKEIIQIPRRK